MKRIPLGKYAKLKKIPRALVIKQILSGQLQAEEVIENGKKVRYILVDETQKPPKEEGRVINCFADEEHRFIVMQVGNEEVLVVQSIDGREIKRVKRCKGNS